jgi:hypothetical protein
MKQTQAPNWYERRRHINQAQPRGPGTVVRRRTADGNYPQIRSHCAPAHEPEARRLA